MGGRTNVHDKSEVVGHLQLSDNIVEVLSDQNFVKYGASQIQKFHVNFHKFHSVFSKRFSQLGYSVTSFAQDGFRKC
jgi:hypothetical protein